MWLQEENDDVWSKDQTSRSGAEPTSLEEEPGGNSDAPGNVNHENLKHSIINYTHCCGNYIDTTGLG